MPARDRSAALSNQLMQRDIRDDIFAGLTGSSITASVSTEADGVICGLDTALRQASELGLSATARVQDGAAVRWGDIILLVQGPAKSVVQAEDFLLGAMAKPSGIATAAAEAVRRSTGKVRIVAGAWKKMPPELKTTVRGAVAAGGAASRIVEAPFLYLDKNYLRIFGGIVAALAATAHLAGYLRVVQVRGEEHPIAEEAVMAAASGAGIVMLDSGESSDIDRVSARLKEAGLRDRVQIAFAGGISLEAIEALSSQDVDILDVGSAIVDAPLMPLRFDVISPARSGASIELNLLEKTELWLKPIRLEHANLQAIAAATAETLGLNPDEVLVTDVRDDVVTLDILRRTLSAEQIAGKSGLLLARLAAIPGVTVSDQTGVHSEGVLGLIALNDAEAGLVLRSGRELGNRVRQAIARRAMVFPTGGEVCGGIIEDTNTGYIAEHLRRRGFRVATGPALPDDRERITGAIRRAVGDGYGLVITTGGVGAEDKDQTVEGILHLDPGAATPYLAHFRQGTGRHVKDGVRIAVGEWENAMIVALPGPHEEVRVGMEVVLEGLRRSWNKSELADALAEALRGILREKMHRHH